MSEVRASYLMDILDVWLDECAKARHDLEVSEPFQDVDELLDAVGNFDMMERETVSLREEIFVALRKRRAESDHAGSF